MLVAQGTTTSRNNLSITPSTEGKTSKTNPALGTAKQPDSPNGPIEKEKPKDPLDTKPVTTPDKPKDQPPPAQEVPVPSPPSKSPEPVAKPKIPDAEAQAQAEKLASLPMNFACRRDAWRPELLRAGGGNEKSEAAVSMGLEWLAKMQKGDGGWESDGSAKAPVASTGIGLLPFLAAGYTHKGGVQFNKKEMNKYVKNVANGIDYLVKLQRPTGDFGTQNMYEHAIATMALCEAFGMTQDPKLHHPCQRAIQFIVKAQHLAGGWRYGPGQAGDTSVTGWQIQALKSAQLAGLSVPKETLQRAMLFLDSVSGGTQPGSTYGYTDRNGSTTMTAVGLLCRQYLGWGQHNPSIVAGISELKKIPPKGATAPNQVTDIYWYYYASLVVHNYDGPDWQVFWNPPMRDWLVNLQLANGISRGSWDPDQNITGSSGGRLFTTAMALLTLEIYYRYPILFRANKNEAKDNEKPRDRPNEIGETQNLPMPLEKRPADSARKVDLIPGIKLSPDNSAGPWKSDSAGLVSPTAEKWPKNAWVSLPQIPSQEYRIEMEVERLENGQGLNLGIVMDGQRCTVVVDGFASIGGATGLEMVDGKLGKSNETTRFGQRLPLNKRRILAVTVSKGSIQLACDGEEVFSWSGEHKQLALAPMWQEIPESNRLFLGTQASFRFHKIVAIASDSKSREQVTKGQWVPLFNGKDLTGWQGAIQIDKRLRMNDDERKRGQQAADTKTLPHWHAENGVLVNDGEGDNLSSTKDYGDFELLVDWKIEPRGDSGIYLRGIPQIQIWDSDSLDRKRFPKDFRKGSGGLWNNKNNNVPLKKADKPPGDWNTFHAIIKGDKVTVHLNDELVVDQVRLENSWEAGQPIPNKGPIELQRHQKNDGTLGKVWFKNIYIRELE
jgi:hypothetical protein